MTTSANHFPWAPIRPIQLDAPPRERHRRFYLLEWISKYFFKKDSVEASTSLPDKVIEAETDELEPDQGDVILCAFCMARITSKRDGVAINSRHQHRFTNPQNFTYEIRCFGKTTNCAIHGEPTTEHTWFPGYAWQVTTCIQCRAHLGWKYTGTEPTFFGLINQRLLDES